MNINGSYTKWINVWTHFVLEYFITQYLKGSMSILDISTLSPTIRGTQPHRNGLHQKHLTHSTSAHISSYWLFEQFSLPIWTLHHSRLLKWVQSRLTANWLTILVAHTINPSHVIIISVE